MLTITILAVRMDLVAISMKIKAILTMEAIHIIPEMEAIISLIMGVITTFLLEVQLLEDSYYVITVSSQVTLLRSVTSYTGIHQDTGCIEGREWQLLLLKRKMVLLG